uniref:isoleucine--tRNA ligase n=1 Tax=Lepisosteus oculatus TaxID=7918 RepID=W5NK95_LEPOC
GAQVSDSDLCVQRCGFSELYSWQRERKVKKEFCLHDGPPYANGDTHVGHALNKVLYTLTPKASSIRTTSLCSGPPPAGKTEQGRSRGEPVSVNQTQLEKCGSDGNESGSNSRMNWWSVWGMSTCLCSSVLLFSVKWYLYFSHQAPVCLSPCLCRTALAEAELEYNPNHVSQAVYTTFPVITPPPKLASATEDWCSVGVLVWTTQPWTLPANEAICYMPNAQYSVVRRADNSQLHLVATERIASLATLLGTQLDTTASFTGSELEGGVCSHPFIPGKASPLLPANHVTMGKGTGLVHTAPAHGMEDYSVASHFKLPVNTVLAPKRTFLQLAQLFHTPASLSLCWTCPIPLPSSAPSLFSAIYLLVYSPPVSFFLSSNTLIDPPWHGLPALSLFCGGVTPMVQQCGPAVSCRGRAGCCDWGVSVHRHCGDKSTGRCHSVPLPVKRGLCPWIKRLRVLLPVPVRCAWWMRRAGSWSRRGRRLTPVWRASWMTVCLLSPADSDPQADVYVEGKDQLGGWFQSSLLTSVAVRNKAPYRSLVVHGFALSEQGEKMSKSLGNVMDPDTVINGGPVRTDTVSHTFISQARDRYAEHITQHEQEVMPLSDGCFPQLITKQGRHYEQSYALCVSLGAVASSKSPLTHESASKRPAVPEGFLFHPVPLSLRLYCDPESSLGRRSCQTVLEEILDGVTHSIAPILPHLAEEVYLHSPGRTGT